MPLRIWQKLWIRSLGKHPHVCTLPYSEYHFGIIGPEALGVCEPQVMNPRIFSLEYICEGGTQEMLKKHLLKAGL